MTAPGLDAPSVPSTPSGTVRRRMTADDYRTPGFPCQVRTLRSPRGCQHHDSRFVYCELPPHGDEADHWISEHTVDHDLLGNGYSCGPHPETPTGTGWPRSAGR